MDKHFVRFRGVMTQNILTGIASLLSLHLQL